jgi:hypothetical protein
VRKDRGEIGVLDLVVAMMIIGILIAALMGIVGSAFSTTAAIESRVDFFNQRAQLSEKLRTMLTGAAPSGGCLDRVDPALALSTSNCQHFIEESAVLVSGTATSMCSLVSTAEGLQTTANPLSDPLVLLPSQRMCIQANEDGDVIVNRRPADQSTEYVTATWAEDMPQGERLSSRTQELSFSYYDANSDLIVPAADGALSTLQLKDVRRVKSTAIFKSANGSTSEALIVEVAVGAGRFVDEQRWQGR